MDRRDSQSSLPSSLIPHLYAAPRDSSTRTTLTSHSVDSDHEDSSLPFLPPIPPFIRRRSTHPPIADNRQLPPPVFPANPSYPSRSLEPSQRSVRASPTYSNRTLLFPSSQSSTSILLPTLASLKPDVFPHNLSWREGEAGPSSLVHPDQRKYDSRDTSQPARVISPPNTFGYGSTSREIHRRDNRYYPTFSHQSVYDTPISQLAPLQNPGPIPPPLSINRRFSYPKLGTLSISDSNYSRQASTPEPEPPSGSEPVSANIGSNEGEDSRTNKKRPSDSTDIDNNPKKASRKTSVACNFCRGRKLRCDGMKPSPCQNCTQRNYECEYVSTQRRRGPGKAKKGSRSRKGRQDSSFGDRMPTMVPDTELPPDLRPFTSVLSFPRQQPPMGSAEDHSDAKYIQSGS